MEDMDSLDWPSYVEGYMIYFVSYQVPNPLVKNWFALANLMYQAFTRSKLFFFVCGQAMQWLLFFLHNVPL